MIGRAVALAFVLLALVAGACTGGSQQAATTSSSTPSGQTLGPSTRLTDLAHPDETPDLFSLFNAGHGVPRLILLVSPT